MIVVKGVTFIALFCVFACSSNSTLEFVPDDYTFASRFVDGSDGVENAESVLQNLLIEELDGYLANIQSETLPVTAMGVELLEKINNDFYWFGAESEVDCRPTDSCSSDGGADGQRMIQYAPFSGTFDDIGAVTTSERGGILKQGIAGFVQVHRQLAFEGTSDGSADELVQSLLSQIAQRYASVRNQGATGGVTASGLTLNDPNGDGDTSDALYTTATDGTNLRLMLALTLRGAIAYHQISDLWLDDSIQGAGILQENGQLGNAPYSGLEHSWDLAFGLWGAARDSNLYSLEAIVNDCANCVDGPSTRSYDSNGDGVIDTSETHWGLALQHAKASIGTTDTYQRIWNSFKSGRALIFYAGFSIVSEEDREEIRDLRNLVLFEMERAFATSAIRAIDNLTAAMDKWDPASDPSGSTFPIEDFLEISDAWSELKGNVLTFQYSPHATLAPEELTELHTLIGLAPTVPQLGITSGLWLQKRSKFVEAKDLLSSHFGQQ